MDERGHLIIFSSSIERKELLTEREVGHGSHLRATRVSADC